MQESVLWLGIPCYLFWLHVPRFPEPSVLSLVAWASKPSLSTCRYFDSALRVLLFLICAGFRQMRDGGDVYGGLVWPHLVTGLPCVDWNQVRFRASLALVCIFCIITVPPCHGSVYFCNNTFLMQSLPPLHMVQNVTPLFCSSFSVYRHLAVWGNIVLFHSFLTWSSARESIRKEPLLG